MCATQSNIYVHHSAVFQFDIGYRLSTSSSMDIIINACTAKSYVSNIMAMKICIGELAYQRPLNSEGFWRTAGKWLSSYSRYNEIINSVVHSWGSSHHWAGIIFCVHVIYVIVKNVTPYFNRPRFLNRSLVG